MSNDIKYPEGYDVYWEEWKDPYHQEVEDSRRDMDELDFDEDDDEDDDEFDDIMFPYRDEGLKKHYKSLMTPFGVLPLTEQVLASTHFKIWTGHTNFKLGDGEKTSIEDFEKAIGSCNGVESVDIMTPYRFNISVGKLFRDSDVMYEVKESLTKFAEKSYGKQR